MDQQPIIVAAAVIERDGALLLARRLKGTHLEDYWEFPGGKCHAGESYDECLRREIREELGSEITIGPEIFSATHAYEDRTVELHFYRCEIEGNVVPLLGQEIAWATRDDLMSLQLPQADAELIRMLAGQA